MDMKNLKRTAADKKAEKDRKEKMGWPIPPEPDDYPQGAQISLGEDELKKLGITALPKAGDMVTFIGRGKIIAVHSEAEPGKAASDRVQIQITHMGMQKQGGKSAADKVYGGSDDEGMA